MGGGGGVASRGGGGWGGRRRRRWGGGDFNEEAGTASEHHLFSTDGDLLQIRRQRQPPRGEAAPRRRMALQRLLLRHVRQPHLSYGRSWAEHVLQVLLRLSGGLPDEGERHGGDSECHHHFHV